MQLTVEKHQHNPTQGDDKICVGLVQINNSFSNQSYLPYSVGLLQAYTQRWAVNPQRYSFLLPIFKRSPMEQIVQSLDGANIVGFSVYMWNIRLSLAAAELLKKNQPETIIIFGGPQVPDNAKNFLAEHPFIDICCHGEGEGVFLNLLESYPGNCWDETPGISYLQADGVFVNNDRTKRLSELSNIPSPYLEGLFAPLMQAHAKEQWLAMWETNRGCPFSCSFCDWGSAVSSKVFQFDMERLTKEIEWFSKNRIEFIFCCDANFGILRRDMDLVNLVAAAKKARKYPNALSVQNTKNSSDRTLQIQKILNDSGLGKGVSIALQSVDEHTLESINRQNIRLDKFLELQHLFHREGITTFTDIIIGLPGETMESFMNGVDQVIDSGQHNRIQFIHLAVLPNAEMGDPAYQEKYGMLMVESKLINNHGILTDNEEIQETQDLVVGTKAMPQKDWVSSCTFSFMTALLHFNKLLQIPLILARENGDIGYRQIIEGFCNANPETYPIIAGLSRFFSEKAKSIQQGGPEFHGAPQWLNIWWPAHEFITIRLCFDNQMTPFYQEAQTLLLEMQPNLPAAAIEDAINLNHALFKQPLLPDDSSLSCRFNIYEYYQSILMGTPCQLIETPTNYKILRSLKVWSSWDDWLREVIWFGHKKGDYLYTVETTDT
jgi:radical SAM superfamily enzyme YgiQ (UPF0313 family)